MKFLKTTQVKGLGSLFLVSIVRVACGVSLKSLIQRARLIGQNVLMKTALQLDK